MLDATGKFPDGIVAGNLNALGSYTSCLKIEANPKNSSAFSGKFGGANFLGGALPLVYGVCLPSSCTDEDFYSILCAIDRKIHNVSSEEELINNCTNRILWIPHISDSNEKYQLEVGDIVMM